jgi:hypothetical protein
MNDKILIDAICKDCLKQIKIAYGHYRRKDKHNNEFRCKDCNIKYRAECSKNWHKNLPKEDKIIHYSSAIKGRKKWWNNLSKDEQDTRIKIMHSGLDVWYSELSDEDRLNYLIPMWIGKKEWYDNLSEEELSIYGEKISISQLKLWKELSEDKKEMILNNLHNGYREWYSNLSKEDKIKHYTPLKNSSDEFWSNITPEERNMINRKISIGKKRWWNNLTPEEYEEWAYKTAIGYNMYITNLNITPNKNESSFINLLNINNIKYRFIWYNTMKDSEFHNIFPFNPVTGSYNISPYHAWDFIIYTKRGNILVDIDGSIHFIESYRMIHPYTKIEYSMLDYLKFKDSQRPYQTDGLEAYVIQCYDNNLTLKTKVLSLQNNTIISIKELLNSINISNMSKKEIKKFIKNTL